MPKEWKQGGYHGRKPRYVINPAHVPGPTFVRGKTPLPHDAEEAYRHAIPDPDGRAWWTKVGESYYRYQGEPHEVHFNGTFDYRNALRIVSTHTWEQLNR